MRSSPFAGVAVMPFCSVRQAVAGVLQLLLFEPVEAM